MKHIPISSFALALAFAALLSPLACSNDGPQIITGAGGEPDPMEPNDSNGGTTPTPPNEPPAPETTDPDPTDDVDETKEVDPDPDTPAAVDAGPLTPPPPPTPAFISPRGACDVATRVGGFTIEKQVNFGVVQGAIADGVVPTAIPRIALSEGGCELRERRNLACIPACVGAQTCGEDGTCLPYPRQVSVGDVRIAGLTKETVMSPQQPGNSYFSPGADNPPYAVGSQVVLSAAGRDGLAAFDLFGVGSEPLALAPTWVLTPGEDLAITWPAPTSNAPTTVAVELLIDQHGVSPLTLACEFPDTGSASVPAAIIEQMITAGVSGFPNGRVSRRTADHLDLSNGCVDLIVGSPLAASVSVAGFTPCNTSEECPDGQTCNVPLQRCE